MSRAAVPLGPLLPNLTGLTEQTIDRLPPKVAKTSEESLGAGSVGNHHGKDHADDDKHAEVEEGVHESRTFVHQLGQQEVAQGRSDKQPDDMGHAHTSFPFPVTAFQTKLIATATTRTAIQNAGSLMYDIPNPSPASPCGRTAGTEPQHRPTRKTT